MACTKNINASKADKLWEPGMFECSEHLLFSCLCSKVTYPKIPNKGRISNNMCTHLFWRKKINWKIKGAHQIKSARTLFEMRPLMFNRYFRVRTLIGILGYYSDTSAVLCYTLWTCELCLILHDVTRGNLSRHERKLAFLAGNQLHELLCHRKGYCCCP